jgi:exopolysaccharide production protein ExoY
LAERLRDENTHLWVRDPIWHAHLETIYYPFSQFRAAANITSFLTQCNKCLTNFAEAQQTAGREYDVMRAQQLAHSDKRRLAPVNVAAESNAHTARELWSTSTPKPAQSPFPVGGFRKRAIDIAIAASGLILLSPVMVFVAIMIWLTMGRPVLFGHNRIGHDGRAFRCYKFRTMIEGAEDVLRQYLASNPDAEKEWRETHKLRNDPRITPLGAFLRKSSIDELPQLINVLRGDMSCVGPRPIVTDELARYGEKAADYLRARPGLTGAWQVSGRTSLSYADRVALDAEYVRQWSVWKDLLILAKTVPAVLSFEDAS